MNDFEIKIFDELDKSLEEKVESFRKKNPGNSSRTKQEKLVGRDKFCSDHDIKKWVLALQDGEVIGVIAIFQRQVRFENEEIVLGGIGKVRVASAERKKGIASAMMNVAMKVLSEIGSDVASLCTNIDSFLPEWYKKYGFVLSGKQYTYLGLSGRKYAEKNGMLASINSESKFQLIINSDKVFNIGVGNW